MKHYSSTVLMVEPVDFRYNAQTAVNNYFQTETDEAHNVVQQKALSEFSNMVAVLRQHGVEVIVLKDTPLPHTPDSIFPNNWITFHEDGRIALYPMFAKNRRLERRPQEVFSLLKEHGFQIKGTVDYTPEEEKGVLLEGTGSIILDRVNHIAWAALSPRTDKALFERFCNDFGYQPVIFVANQTVQGQRMPIYHTNVVMCAADTFAVICLDSIDDAQERAEVEKSLESSGKEIIAITQEQMHQFAGNMLQVGSTSDQRFLVMSETAKKSLTDQQIKSIESHNPILQVDIETIETHGGGSARCMLAEVFLPKI